MSATNLVLTSDNIEELSNGLFNNGGGEIDLSNKGIETLQDDLFADMELEKLDLSHNKLKDIPAGVFKNATINSLLLNHNEFKAITKAGFADVEAIQFLILNDNLIESVEPGCFSKMVRPAFVYLYNNRIESIPSGLFDSNVYVELKLAQNNIKSICPAAFEGAAFSYLDLSDNKLEELKRNTFDSALQIEYLLLSNNNIKTIEPHTLDKVTKGVQLEGNELEVVRKDALKFANIVVLMNNKKLRKIEVGAFDDSDRDPEMYPAGEGDLPRKLYLEKDNKLDGESKEYLNGLVSSGKFEWHNTIDTDNLFPFS